MSSQMKWVVSPKWFVIAYNLDILENTEMPSFYFIFLVLCCHLGKIYFNLNLKHRISFEELVRLRLDKNV